MAYRHGGVRPRSRWLRLRSWREGIGLHRQSGRGSRFALTITPETESRDVMCPQVRPNLRIPGALNCDRTRRSPHGSASRASVLDGFGLGFGMGKGQKNGPRRF